MVEFYGYIHVGEHTSHVNCLGMFFSGGEISAPAQKSWVFLVGFLMVFGGSFLGIGINIYFQGLRMLNFRMSSIDE